MEQLTLCFLVKDEHSINLLCINTHLQAKTNSYLTLKFQCYRTNQQATVNTLREKLILHNIFLKFYNTIRLLY